MTGIAQGSCPQAVTRIGNGSENAGCGTLRNLFRVVSVFRGGPVAQ